MDALLEPRISRRSLLAQTAVAVGGALGLPAVSAAASPRSLAYGATGSRVRALNARLAELTFLPSTARSSPRFDAPTYHAVVAFQKHAKLVPDGVAGPRTLAALEGARRPIVRATGPPERIVVSLASQLAFVVAGNRVRRTISVSTGRPGFRTPRGRFSIYRREVRSWSRPYAIWLPWAAYFTGGIAFHGHAEVPPYPASHGCVRVPEPMARELYEFARIGRAVVVV